MAKKSFSLLKKGHYVSFFPKLYYLFKTWSPQCLKPGSAPVGCDEPVTWEHYFNGSVLVGTYLLNDMRY